MTIAFQNIVYRSRRRVRLVFSNTLAAGAFSSAWFTFASTDDLGAVPDVRDALIVGDSPNTLELALSLDLADGAGYTVSAAAGIPATDASTTAGVVTLPMRAPSFAPADADKTATDGALDELYRVDLVFDGNDYVEGPDGDLATVRGVENVELALERRMISDGLQWRDNYGARPRQYVDGSAPTAAELKAAMIEQARRDDRVKTATVTTSAITNQADQYRFDLEAKLVGNRIITTSATGQVS